MQNDPKKLFTTKVENYVKYRPKYSEKFISYLFEKLGIAKDSIVADIGSGTGILSRQLSPYCKKVYAIEPNVEMRQASEVLNKDFENIKSINGSGESTTLSDSCVNYITVAQAFHWFDIDKSKIEFKRILNPNGKLILVWNWTDPDSDLIKEYSEILYRFCPNFKGLVDKSDFKLAKHSKVFANEQFEHLVFENNQTLDLDAFLGECFSSSFTPNHGDKYYEVLKSELTILFNKYAHNKIMYFPTNTHSFIGRV